MAHNPCGEPHSTASRRLTEANGSNPLNASDPETSARRLSTYQLAQRFQPLDVDETVAEHWALLVSRLRAAGRTVPINDSWIAATALAYGIPIATQDGDYDAMPDLQVIKL